jgi:hypothetical protein
MRKHVNHSDSKEVVISISKLYKSFGENHVLQGLILNCARERISWCLAVQAPANLF